MDSARFSSPTQLSGFDAHNEFGIMQNILDSAHQRGCAAYTYLKHPDPDMAPACYWFWQHIPTKEEIERQLNEMKELGFGMIFPAARLSLPIEQFLSEKWFEAWREACECAKKLKLRLGIYDDYNWLSGHAGGRTVKLNANLRERHLFYSVIPVKRSLGSVTLTISGIHAPDAECLGKAGMDWIYEGGRPLWDEWELIALFAVTPKDKGGTAFTELTAQKAIYTLKPGEDGLEVTVKTSTLTFEEGALVLFAAARCKTSRMINYLLPASGKAFVKAGLEPYAQHLGEYLGEDKVITKVFFDQPHACFYNWREQEQPPMLPGLTLTPARPGSSLLYARDLMTYLKKDAKVSLLSLLFDLGPKTAHWRCNFYDVYGYLCRTGFMVFDLRGWCMGHNLELTGHEVLGHVGSFNFVDKVITDDPRSSFAMDYFALDHLRGLTAADCKNSDPQLTAKMGESVASEQHRNGCLIEQYYSSIEPGSHFGAGQWELSFDDLTRQVYRNHLMGMNQLLLHAYYLEDGSADNEELFSNPRFDFAPGFNFEPWCREKLPQLLKISAHLGAMYCLLNTRYDLAILYPLYNFHFLGVDLKQGQLCAALSAYLSSHGYDYLYIDDRDLAQWRVDPVFGLINEDQTMFRALLLPDVKVLGSAGVLRSIERLVKEGLNVYFLGGMPEYTVQSGYDKNLSDSCRALLRRYPDRVHLIPITPGFYEAFGPRGAADALSCPYHPLLESIAKPYRRLRLHCEYAPRPYPVWTRLACCDFFSFYGIFNDGPELLDLTIRQGGVLKTSFQVRRLNLAGDDPTDVPFDMQLAADGRLNLTLKPYELVYLEFAEEQRDYLEIQRQVFLRNTLLPVQGWQLQILKDGFKPGDVIPENPAWGEAQPIAVERGWQEQWPGAYCGPARYLSPRLDFKFKHPDKPLPPGSVFLKVKAAGCVQLALNGVRLEPVSTIADPRTVFDLSAQLQQGPNTLELIVTPSAGNYYYAGTAFRKSLCPTGILEAPALLQPRGVCVECPDVILSAGMITAAADLLWP